jgi:hypothetical protein
MKKPFAYNKKEKSARSKADPFSLFYFLLIPIASLRSDIGETIMIIGCFAGRVLSCRNQ